MNRGLRGLLDDLTQVKHRLEYKGERGGKRLNIHQPT